MERSAATGSTLTTADGGGHALEPPSGLAHVATASFLASRAAPSAGFWIALAGGVALARAGEERGVRTGYGASIAAMLQTVAVMGPARFGVPLTQALSAPLLGRLEGRRVSVLRQMLTCAAIRLTHTTITLAFFALVLAGGLDAYTDTYDSVAGRLPLIPEGTTAALVATGIGLLAWAAFASVVQVLVYRRGLKLWPHPAEEGEESRSPDATEELRRRFDPRAIATAAAIAFCLLLASTAWPLLAAVSVWLALAWTSTRGDREVVMAGVVIATFLAAGVLLFALVGGIGAGLALRRGARAGLLVLVATWLRSAAGSEGLREVSRRVLRRLRRLPSVPEASRVLDELGSGRQLGTAAGSALEALRGVDRRPVAVLDAVLDWVAAEAARFRAAPPAPAARLVVRPRDSLLVALAAAPLAAIVAL
jgi:hypothetical protein